MFCPNCGTQNADGAVFCANCGTALAAAAPAQQPAAQQPAAQQPAAQQPAGYDQLVQQVQQQVQQQAAQAPQANPYAQPVQQPQQPVYQQPAYQQPVAGDPYAQAQQQAGAPYAAVPAAAAAPAAQAAAPKKGGKGLIIGIIAAVAVVAVVLLGPVLHVFGGNSSSSSGSGTSTPATTSTSGSSGGSTATTAPVANDEDAFVGRWDLVGMYTDGEETAREEIDLLREMGMEIYLQLDEDGDASLVLFDESMDGSWRTTGTNRGKLTIDGDTVDMYIDGDQLVLEEDDETLTFEQGVSSGSSSTLNGGTSGSSSSSGSTSGGIATQLGNSGSSGSSSSSGNTSFPITIVDDETFKVVVTGKHVDDYGDPGYDLLITNNLSDDAIDVYSGTTTWTVGNGSDAWGVLIVTPEPGETVEAFLWFDHDDLGSSSFEDLEPVTGTIKVTYADEYDVIDSCTFSMP